MPRKHAIHIAMNSHRGKIPHPYAISATLRNFSDNANSRNASTTLNDVIQSPDLGACLSHCGNKANSENGKAKAIAKPNIPIAGANKLRPAASTSNVPMIGPVQLNETITSVNAISRILRNPPVLRALLSNAVDQLSGKVISNNPKNDSANTTRIRKNTMFTTALVLKSFSADAPNAMVTNNPSPTYRIMILSP